MLGLSVAVVELWLGVIVFSGVLELFACLGAEGECMESCCYESTVCYRVSCSYYRKLIASFFIIYFYFIFHLEEEWVVM